MSRRIFQVLIVLSLALLYAGSRIKIVEMGYDVSRLKSEAAEMTRTNNLLKSKVAQAKSTARLADWVKQLGLVSPEASQVLFLGE